MARSWRSLGGTSRGRIGWICSRCRLAAGLTGARFVPGIGGNRGTEGGRSLPGSPSSWCTWCAGPVTRARVRFVLVARSVARTPPVTGDLARRRHTPPRTPWGAPPPPYLFKLPYFLTFFKGCPCRGLGVFDVGRSRDVPPLAANALPSPAWLSKCVVVIRVLSHR
jgi:hypothetical protein